MVLSVRLKNSLDLVSKKNVVVPPLTKKQIKLREAKDRDYQLTRSRKPLTNATAKSVIEKKLNIKLDKLAPDTKFSEDQLAVLFKNTNKRLIYSFLGISGEQLKDALIVNSDVKKFLARGEVSKAIYLCKLAGKKGTVAMNFVMQYYLDNGRSDDAISLFQYRKKWGVPVNEVTYTILFDGLSNQKTGLGTKLINFITKNLQTLKERDELSIIHVNAAMKAIYNSNEPLSALKVMEALPKDIKLDNKSYSIIFKGLSQIKGEDNTVIKHANDFFKAALQKLKIGQIDPQMVFSFAMCYSTRDHLKYVSISTNILRSWFDLCEPEKITQVLRFSEPFDYKFRKLSPILEDLIQLNDLNPSGKRFPVNNMVLDSYIYSLGKLGLFNDALKVFKQYRDNVQVDITLYNKVLASISKIKSEVKRENLDRDKMFEYLEEMLNSKIVPNFETNIILRKFVEQKIKSCDAGFIINYITALYSLLARTNGPKLTVNQTIDYLKLFSQVQNSIQYADQMKFLQSAYFENLQLTDISKHIGDSKEQHKIRTLEITMLTCLKNLKNALEAIDANEITWSWFNRIRNSIQKNVHYIDHIHEIEDPGYTRLNEIEKEKQMSIRSYEIMIMKLKR